MWPLPEEIDRVLRVRAPGYEEFEVGIRYRIKRSKWMEAGARDGVKRG